MGGGAVGGDVGWALGGFKVVSRVASKATSPLIAISSFRLACPPAPAAHPPFLFFFHKLIALQNMLPATVSRQLEGLTTQQVLHIQRQLTTRHQTNGSKVKASNCSIESVHHVAFHAPHLPQNGTSLVCYSRCLFQICYFLRRQLTTSIIK